MRARIAGLVVVAAAAVASFVAAAPAGAALSGCDEQMQQPYLPWLDPLSYYLMPGGSFDDASGWGLSSGASVVSGNDPYYVDSRTSTRSLYLAPGASATSPWTCVGLTEPTLRFMAVNSGSPLASLSVTVQYRDRSGTVRSLLPLPVLGAGHLAWTPTLPLPIAVNTVLKDVLTLDLRTTQVRFVLHSSGGLLTSGKWRVDSMYVDPLVSGW